MKAIHVGLTGLSRAGKTVFLTSAIHSLLEHTGRDLSEFKFNGWRCRISGRNLKWRTTAQTSSTSSARRQRIFSNTARFCGSTASSGPAASARGLAGETANPPKTLSNEMIFD
jgi:hypothetical protein